MKTPQAADVKKGIAVLWDTLQCPICLDLLTEPVSTNCDHQFCRFCITKLLENSKQNRGNCPVCKARITKRSLQESPGFQRLVAGLQDMIQGYEHDTGKNYFTGLDMQERQSSSEATAPSPGVTPVADLEQGENAELSDLPRSNSSTVAAQNGFARLMELNDSTENEGLDSGLGDIPIPTADRRIPTSAENAEPDETEVIDGVENTAHKTRSKSRSGKSKRTTHEPLALLDETENQLIRKSSRKKHKKDSEPDKIRKEKRKRSLEKVAEWLMKVPTDGSVESEKTDESDHDSDSSSSSTVDIKLQISDMESKRVDRAKALEEHVFGAVYKRGRGAKRTTCPHLHAGNETLMATKNNTGPEDQNQGDFNAEHSVMEEENDASSDVFEEREQMEVTEENSDKKCREELIELTESDKKKNTEEENGPKSDFQLQRSRRRSKENTHKVDSDLKEHAETKLETTEQKKNARKKGTSALSEKSKAAKTPKPLVMVGVQNGDISPRTWMRSEEVQVQIENYPSSEDPQTPIIRSMRRSRRLQLFAAEVQEVHTKACPKDEEAAKDDIDGKPPGDVEEKSTEKTNTEKMTKVTKINGCIYDDDDLGGIEQMDLTEATSHLDQEFVSQVSNAEVLCENSAACCVPVVPNSESPAEGTAVGPTLESNNPKDEFEKSAFESKCAITEDDRNDSELDTEQLMRSFKATKRKSFHLGGPELKRSRTSDHGNTQNAEASKTESEKILKALIDDENSCSVLIPPSTSPVEKQDQAVAEASNPVNTPAADHGHSRSSLSSGLSPNKVTKLDTESPHLSVVPQIADSGLRFTAVHSEDSNDASECSHISNTPPDCSVTDAVKCEATKGTTEHVVAAESLTPDGLVAVVQTVNELGGSAESPVKRNLRKKRKVQRLESSSESDSGGEELPSLSQMMESARGRTEPSGALGCEAASVPAADEAEELSRPPACPSPDGMSCSQASVDLFGTLDEGDVPVNDNSVSVESSQFSNEVLATQQKIQMQKELVRLEKLMALVSEALQEKECSPAKETNHNGKATAPDAHREPPRCKDTCPESKQEGAAENAKEPSARASDVRDVKPSVPAHGGESEITAQRSTHTGPSVQSTDASRTAAGKSCVSPSDAQEDKENTSPPKDRSKPKLVFVSSGLGPSEQIMVKKFALRVGARVVSQITPEVTHIIMRTDEQLVCERTLKYFLGIAGRKWVVSFFWIAECFKQKKLLEESLYEVKGDVVSGPNHQGPARARTTNNSNLLMRGFKVCLQGPFTDMTTDELEWMVELCGAAVVKDPLHFDSKQKSHQIVVTQPRPEAVAAAPAHSSLSRRATVVSRGWLLDTVSTYTLQSYTEYLL